MKAEVSSQKNDEDSADEGRPKASHLSSRRRPKFPMSHFRCSDPFIVALMSDCGFTCRDLVDIKRQEGMTPLADLLLLYNFVPDTNFGSLEDAAGPKRPYFSKTHRANNFWELPQRLTVPVVWLVPALA